MLGICKVDAFYIFCSFNVHTKQLCHSVFTVNQVITCLINSIPGTSAPTKHIKETQVEDDEENSVYQNDVQQIELPAMPILKYFETRLQIG